MILIIDIIKEKYKIIDVNQICINDMQLIEFNLNAYVNAKILKNKDSYNLLLSIINNHIFPSKNITINLEYKSYEKLLYDLECFHFHFHKVETVD